MKCPVCSDIATRHFDHQRVYWFCHHCWQEVPTFEMCQVPPIVLSESTSIMAKLHERIAQQRHALLLPDHSAIPQ